MTSVSSFTTFLQTSVGFELGKPLAIYGRTAHDAISSPSTKIKSRHHLSKALAELFSLYLSTLLIYHNYLVLTRI